MTEGKYFQVWNETVDRRVTPDYGIETCECLARKLSETPINSEFIFAIKNSKTNNVFMRFAKGRLLESF